MISFQHMGLHRIGRVADWHAVSASKRNVWQRVAARTHGLITPGNAVSIIGAILAFWGMMLIYKGELWFGLVILAFGRLGDILDGYVADATGTKSSVGETLDAGLDKATVFGALVLFLALQLAPLWLIVLLGIQQFAAALIGAYAKASGMDLHPSSAGKLTMTAQWAIMLGYILADGIVVSDTWYALLHMVFAGTILAGFIVTSGYLRHVLRAARSRH